MSEKTKTKREVANRARKTALQDKRRKAKTSPLLLRLSESEHKAVMGAAARHDVSAAEYIRVAVARRIAKDGAA